MSDTYRIKIEFLVNATAAQAQGLAALLYEFMDNGDNFGITVVVENELEKEVDAVRRELSERWVMAERRRERERDSEGEA